KRCCSPAITPCRPNNTEPYFVANRRGEHPPPLGKRELVAVIRSSCALPYATFSHRTRTGARCCLRRDAAGGQSTARHAPSARCRDRFQRDVGVLVGPGTPRS